MLGVEGCVLGLGFRCKFEDGRMLPSHLRVTLGKASQNMSDGLNSRKMRAPVKFNVFVVEEA